ncbi:MAG: hypothetical protein ABI811_22240 [Acidobacteriota bacterium]
MMLRWVLFLGFAATMFAANIRLYLKDGDYQMVREYQVKEDRVRFYSLDRGGWEEIPLDLIDLKRTEKENADKAAALAEDLRQEKVEDDAIKADRKLVADIPDAPGPYWIDGSSVVPLIAAEVTMENSKTRRILQVLAPAPIVPGKTTVTVEGKSAKFRLTNSAPEFFFRLAKEERFGIIQLPPKKSDRLVETVEIFPNGEDPLEQQKVIPAFKKQLGPNLYKIWPEEPLEPGEYALVEFTGGIIEIQVWDFAIDKAGEKAKAKK